MTSDLTLPIVLQLLGVTTIIAEFVLPSAGLLTVTAMAVLGYSLFHVFCYVSAEAGMYFVAADVVMIPLSILVGIKLIASSPVTLRKTLTSENGVSSQDSDLQILVGKSGRALTDLRPAGKAIIDGNRFDVVSSGDYIEKNDPIVVSAVNGNRIVVRIMEN
ncbi:NfeD family protein [Desulfonema magnum]|uniref:NfeD-like domain-containing protein n=1 Tax=Desulfonema magnum TaxID=45655 RepID=A0A975GL61_9BACT|nr:NfeD family protein [Desulfonema magnum]QTA85437.1 NfeD-like domain-containing protein [Desulfonema magnum]